MNLLIYLIERTPWDEWLIRHDPLAWVCWLILATCGVMALWI